MKFGVDKCKSIQLEADKLAELERLETDLTRQLLET
jgi:hypothetical protein